MNVEQMNQSVRGWVFDRLVRGDIGTRPVSPLWPWPLWPTAWGPRPHPNCRCVIEPVKS